MIASRSDVGGLVNSDVGGLAVDLLPFCFKQVQLFFCLYFNQYNCLYYVLSVGKAVSLLGA
jgi:hypothetical protein